MFIYIATFLCFSIIAATRVWSREDQIAIPAFVCLYLTLFIGYRYQIGVDWVTYETIFLDNVRSSLFDAVREGDSAYSFTNWVVGRSGGQVWHVNLICAAIFSIGLVQLCRILPQPGLALAVSTPTVIIITAMGYTRQSVAVGCIMLACRAFRGTINWRWVAWLCLSILFHKSALLVFPAFILSGTRNRWVSIVVGGAVAAIVLVLVVSRGLGDTLSLYLEGDIDSSGALPRILVGSIAGLFFFFITNRESILKERSTLFRNLSILMIALLPLYFVFPSRTIIDRIGILLVPFQGVAYAGLAESLRRRAPGFELPFTISVIVAYGAQLLVWLLYATFAEYWIPYVSAFWVKWI